MKTIKEEIVNYKYKYIANDGTEFDDIEECKKYEKSAICVIKERFNNLNPCRHDSVGDDFFMFSCDDTIHTVFIHDEKELNALNMFLHTVGDCVSSVPAEYIGDYVFVIEAYDGWWWSSEKKLTTQINTAINNLKGKED